MMKKYLLGTAAVVACLGFSAGAQADGKINLQLGGYYIGMMAFTDNSFEQASYAFPPSMPEDRSYKFGSDSEVHFKGALTLDNGAVIGFRAELELENDPLGAGPSADTVDEVNIYFKGGWGMVEFGQQDGVGDHFKVQSGRALKILGANDPKQDALNLANITTVNETSFDYTKITYMTPSFSGLKLGVSFSPEAERNGAGFTSAMENVGDEIVEIGGIYQRKIDNVDFAMSATYVIADDSGLTYDLKEWNVGAKVGVADFTFGGSYRDSEGFAVRGMQNRSGGGAMGNQYTAYELGVTYETGPWMVSVQYASHEADDMSGTRIVEGTNTFVQARYNVTKGVQIGAGVQFAENELANQDGTAFIIETALKF
jgi:outer membrane protein OmpU